MGNGQWGMGNGKWEMGHWTVNSEQLTDNCQLPISPSPHSPSPHSPLPKTPPSVIRPQLNQSDNFQSPDLLAFGRRCY